MRRYLALVGILLLVAVALADSVWPAQPPLLIDAAAEPDPPQLLVTPCEIGPRTVPIVDPERTA